MLNVSAFPFLKSISNFRCPFLKIMDLASQIFKNYLMTLYLTQKKSEKLCHMLLLISTISVSTSKKSYNGPLELKDVALREL